MADVAPFEQWRFDALVEAARQTVFGHNWAELDTYRGYMASRMAGVPLYRVPRRW